MVTDQYQCSPTITSTGRRAAATSSRPELTQDELASLIGVNRRVLGELERGKGTVRLEIALAAARMVGLDVELQVRQL